MDASSKEGASTMDGGTPMVPFVDYKLARDALLYWRYECSGEEPSLSVFNRMVDDALTQTHDFEGDSKDAERYRMLRSLQNEDFGALLADEAFIQQVPPTLIDTGDVDAILDYMVGTRRGLQKIALGKA